MQQADFIEVYPQALSREACGLLIKHFEDSHAAVPGRVGGGVLPELKNSADIQITGKAEWREIENTLNAAMFKGLMQYLRKYPHTLIAPLMLQVQDKETGTVCRLAAEDFTDMPDKQLGDIARAMFRPGAINLNATPLMKAVIPTGIASFIRKMPPATPCIVRCYGRCISTMNFPKARPNFCTSRKKSNP